MMSNTYRIEHASDQEQARVHAMTEISRVGVAAVAISSAVIGCWAVACLFSGTISGDGGMAIISNLVKAITG